MANQHPTQPQKMSDVCANCGMVWADHYGMDCPYGGGKFVLSPANHPPKASNVQYSAQPAQPAKGNSKGITYRLFGLTRDDEWMVWNTLSSSLSQAEAFLLRLDPNRRLIAFDSSDPLPDQPLTARQFYDKTASLIHAGRYCTSNEAQAWTILYDWIKNKKPDLHGETELAQAVSHLASLPAKAIGPRKPPTTEIVQDWLERETYTAEGRQRLMDRAWEATKALAKGA